MDIDAIEDDMKCRLDWGIVSYMAVCATLLVSFVGLKLMGIFAFSWWIVLAPLWVPMSTFIIAWTLIVFALIWFNFFLDYDDDDDEFSI